MAYLGNIEYEPDEFGVAVRVKCPLVDTWIDPVDCMENQGNNEAAIPERFKHKQGWWEICKQCPFRDY